MRGGVIGRAKDWAKRCWPRLRLRTIVFATLFLVAALPGFGAVFLRVYENTLVRQTEAELVAQGAALAAAAAAQWPGGDGRLSPRAILPQADGVDLSQTPILAERPAPAPADTVAADALRAAPRLLPILRATQMTTLAGILLLDDRGRIVAGSRQRGSLAALPEVAAALAGRPTTVLRRNGAYRAVYRFEWLSRAAAIRVHHARPIWVNGRVVGVLLLSRSARALFRGLYEDRGKIAIGIAAIFALLVLLSGILSRGVTRPIERLGQATRAVASGRGSVPEIPPTAAIEIQGLYADFAAMNAAIERRSRYLRDFAYAVSHEFKTPLAGIRGAIELMQDHPEMAAADRDRFLANADADAGRLALLVTRLLELARADMAAPADAATDPLPVVARTADAYRTDGFAITVTWGAEPPPVALPASTIEHTLATLFENSRQAGATVALVAGRVTPSTVVLRVADDGPGVSTGDAGRLFEPFFTTRRSEGGTGLGLAIARSLIEAGGGTIDLADGAAAVFVVTLPIVPR
ncbi:sensor histidine kinase [Sphingomonas melonis]|uniref:histidine kinase n=1 Tax=Sphingomonas melonis TaxID=152682 RepID=A0A7Y9FTB6_9SPHN|nr:signal transduction histidine kinase [Sphingomonas melonis]